jgi:hypothetical protein
VCVALSAITELGRNASTAAAGSSNKISRRIRLSLPWVEWGDSKPQLV